MARPTSSFPVPVSRDQHGMPGGGDDLDVLEGGQHLPALRDDLPEGGGVPELPEEVLLEGVDLRPQRPDFQRAWMQETNRAGSTGLTR